MAGYTLEQLQKMGAKPVQSKGRTLAELQAMNNPGASYKTKEFAKGTGKSVLSTLQGASDIGQKIFGGAANKIVSAATGKQQPAMSRVALPETLTTASNDYQRYGKTTGDIAQFFVPGTGAVKGGNFISKLATGSAKVGGLSAAQTGSAEDGGINALVTAALGPAGKLASKAGKPIADVLGIKLPTRIIESLIKPGVNDFKFGKDPGGAVLSEGLKGRTFGDLVKNIQKKTNSVGKAIDTEVAKVKDRQIDISSAVAQVDDAIAQATTQGEQALVTRLQSIRDGITKTFKNENGKLVATGDKPMVMSVQEALKIKRELGKAAKWTGQAFDNEANQVRVRMFQAIRDSIEKVAPATKALNERYANLITASKAAERRGDVLKRQNFLGFGSALAGGLSGIAGAAVAQGDGKYKALEGLGLAAVGALATKGAGSTFAKTSIANLLKKLAPQERGIVEKALPIINKIRMGIEANRQEE